MEINAHFMEENSYEKVNNDKCQFECKKHHICEKEYTWNPATCSCKNGKYAASIIDDSVITSDEIIDGEAKTYDEETKTQNFYILLAFLLITIDSC